MVTHHIQKRGFTFVELLVTIAVVSLIFGGVLTTVQFTLKLISMSKVSTSALALANERIEYIRSLSYADVGTVGGIPNGAIPQNSTTTYNGFLFHERVLIEYVDSSDDGMGASDVNGIVADYKEVKVEYSWNIGNGTSSIFLLTNVIPPGIESTAGGGTLTVNVFDAAVQPVSGAEVHVYNNTTTTTIDTIRYTNISGVAMFAGAPAAANYQITATKSGYSTDQTYTATTTNPNPVTQHVAVLESAVSTMNFQIDELSNIHVRTVGPATNGSFEDFFADMSKVYGATSTEVIAGDVVLTSAAGLYASSGTLLSIPDEPTPFTAWDSVNWNSTVPSGTALTIQVYGVTETNTYTLIPDADLPGNSLGFATSPIDISMLNTGTYPVLALEATFSSSDTATTSALHDWKITHLISEPSIGNIPFTLTGSKIIGMNASGSPIYKFNENYTTGGTGSIDVSNLEWDLYTVSLGTSAYNISNACSGLPLTLAPGVNEILTMTLVPATQYSLRVTVLNTSGNPISGASVTLSRSGFTHTEMTSSCGQVFFNTGIAPETDYAVSVQASGYVDKNISDVVIDGTNNISITPDTL